MKFSEYTRETKNLADSLLKGEIPLSRSHLKMIELVKPGSKVLEAGCANGFMSLKLKAEGCRVTGIEIDPEFAETARDCCDEVIAGDIEDDETIGKIKGDFDYIVFGDILEHLRDPADVVEKLKPMLKGDGLIIASLPNIGIWWMRRDMLRGQFVYTDTGLLDRTHLRFFCYCTAKKFFEELDLVIQGIHVTSNDFPLKSRLIKLFPKFAESMGGWLAGKRPNLFGFHFVFEVKKPSSF